MLVNTNKVRADGDVSPVLAATAAAAAAAVAVAATGSVALGWKGQDCDFTLPVMIATRAALLVINTALQCDELLCVVTILASQNCAI